MRPSRRRCATRKPSRLEMGPRFGLERDKEERKCCYIGAATRKQPALFITFASLMIFLLLQSGEFLRDSSGQTRGSAGVQASETNASATGPKQPESKGPPGAEALFKLDCQPGEQRQFSYESSTKVWGSSNQQVRLKATLRLKCMEAPTNASLKYLAELVNLTPNFISDNLEEARSSQQQAKRAKLSQQARRRALARQAHFAPGAGGSSAHLAPAPDVDDELQLKAEPIFEEVSETAVRMKRSVSDWFSKAWLSVKDFFGNIFTSSERSSVSREQAFRETGLDIAGQCKAPNGSGKGKGLPFDESVFEDLGPEYYVGASSLGGATVGGYEFSETSDISQLLNPFEPAGGSDGEEATLSFFDDPKPRGQRSRRAAAPTGRKSRQSGQTSASPGEDYERLLKIPFVFLQSRAGKIIEVRFSGEESDPSVKNFKRHLCDLFATNLEAANKTAAATNEVSPIGRHQTKYTVDASANSMEALKESVIKSEGGNEAKPSEAHKQLVRVLATVGSSGQRQKGESGNSEVPLVGAAQDSNEEEGELEIVEGSERTPGESGGGGRQISVLRTINTTSGVQLSSKMLGSEIERMEVRVKQVQQINEGRLVGTAGQLSMSLVQPNGDGGRLPGGSARAKRQAFGPPDGGDIVAEWANIEDISELLQVSTSFSLQMVPVSGPASSPSRPPDVSDSIDLGPTRSKRSAASASGASNKSGEPRRRVKRRRQLVKSAPADSVELQRVLQEWRKQEARLQLSAAELVSETGGALDSERQRLDVLRDQIRQRLNEEFVRNRIRRSLSSSLAGGGGGTSEGHFSRQQVAAVTVARAREASEERPGKTAPQAAKANDLGLGLTQLVLGNGITSRRKGSVYGTLEEVLELETQLAEEQAEGAISRLMRDTVRLDKLRDHCRSTIPALEALCEARGRPLAGGSKSAKPAGGSTSRRGGGGERLNGAEFEAKNERKFKQCRDVLQLVLRLGERQAANLALELVDECNQRLLAAAKSEELGYGPVGKYYRRLRQQLVELLGQLARPSDSLIDKLLARLHYPGLGPAEAAPATTRRPPGGRRAELPEFVYVSTTSNLRPKQQEGEAKYNKSLLKAEDDFNNNDGAGQLVMTLTALAARNSVTRPKRVEVVEKLLHSLRSTSCNLFNAPDLDILESMAHFQEPLDELVGRVLSLARRCKQYEQYVIACVHGLSGQLAQGPVQRFLAEQLRSTNSSCAVKSEILLTLINGQLVRELATVRAEPTSGWPSRGFNRLDETLTELLEGTDKQREPDRRCLRQLAAHYFAQKRPTTESANSASSTRASRTRRAVPNEDNFWDESLCKRWSLPADGTAPTGELPNELNAVLNSRKDQTSGPNDLVDEIDDNSIISAILSGQQAQQSGRKAATRSLRGRSQKLAERELEQGAGNGSASLAVAAAASQPLQLASTASATSQQQQQQAAYLRRRHKCTASKSFGPRNAQASLKAEIVNDLVGARDENKFLARFRLATNFLGNRIDVGRMYLWHQRQTTRAYANILGRSIWDTSQGCKERAPHQALYMPLFDFNLWLVKVSVGLRLSAEMGFFSSCPQEATGGSAGAGAAVGPVSPSSLNGTTASARLGDGAASEPLLAGSDKNDDELQLFPTVSLRAAGEATARLVVARAGMSLASNYGYQGSISVSRQPHSCMSIYSAHQPMNVTFSSWFQLWDSDCHFWGSRGRAEPRATKWRLMGRKPVVWLEDECLAPRFNATVPQPAGGAGERAAAAAGAPPTAPADANAKRKPDGPDQLKSANISP